MTTAFKVGQRVLFTTRQGDRLRATIIRLSKKNERRVIHVRCEGEWEYPDRIADPEQIEIAFPYLRR